ncbi:YfbM family protein [Rivularia sp. PCC 7116]|uniref:YfbM family protein n=1 Tax=Rivularia sp. PCC 7116 TaxID=373994 RepID=UPI0002FA83AE|nr:YfbM family protein [Rivularia sp. PCC 7116]
MTGNYRRISQKQLTELQNHRELITDFLFPSYQADQISELNGSYLCIGKTWHAIHFLLTGTIADDQPPLENIVMGGTPLGDVENPDFDFGPARFLNPSEVKEVAEAISKISKAEFQARFKPSELVEANIYPAILWERGGEEELEFLTDTFLMLVKFFQEAAKHREVVLFYIW